MSRSCKNFRDMVFFCAAVCGGAGVKLYKYTFHLFFLQKVLQKKRFCITIKECYRFRAVV